MNFSLAHGSSHENYNGTLYFGALCKEGLFLNGGGHEDGAYAAGAPPFDPDATPGISLLVLGAMVVWDNDSCSMPHAMKKGDEKLVHSCLEQNFPGKRVLRDDWARYSRKQA